MFICMTCKALFTDKSMQPATNLKAVLADFSAKTLAANGEIDVKGKFAMPGIVRTIQLDGAILPTKATKTATLNFRADGMRPDAIRSVLASLGVESQWKDASASGAVHLESTTNAAGNVIASAKLLNLRLTDGDELAALDHVNINGLSVDPKTGKWHVDAIDGVGPTLSVSREPNGAIATCGLTFSGFGKSPAPAATPQAPAKMPSLPPIEIGQIAWKGVKLNLTDLATPNAAPCLHRRCGLGNQKPPARFLVENTGGKDGPNPRMDHFTTTCQGRLDDRRHDDARRALAGGRS